VEAVLLAYYHSFIILLPLGCRPIIGCIIMSLEKLEYALVPQSTQNRRTVVRQCLSGWGKVEECEWLERGRECLSPCFISADIVNRRSDSPE
jgi:hypothetical protein